MNELRSHAPTAGVSLRLDWCSHEAAKYAVEHWHYSRRMPKGKLVRIGVWEDERFVGVVIFGTGANNRIGDPYSLTGEQVCELVRIALCRHRQPVSRIIRVAVGMLRRIAPGLRLVVSYADMEQGHHGGIYQASNWVYVGQTEDRTAYENQAGKRVHWKQVGATNATVYDGRWRMKKYARESLRVVKIPPKHKYLMPLDDAMRKQILPLSRPYPKRERSVDSGTPVHQTGGEGAIPNRSLDSAYP